MCAKKFLAHAEHARQKYLTPEKKHMKRTQRIKILTIVQKQPSAICSIGLAEKNVHAQHELIQNFSRINLRIRDQNVEIYNFLTTVRSPLPIEALWHKHI